MILGPNGIIDRAKQAKIETEQAILNEQSMLNGMDNYINQQLNGNDQKPVDNPIDSYTEEGVPVPKGL